MHFQTVRSVMLVVAACAILAACGNEGDVAGRECVSTEDAARRYFNLTGRDDPKPLDVVREDYSADKAAYRFIDQQGREAGQVVVGKSDCSLQFLSILTT